MWSKRADCFKQDQQLLESTLYLCRFIDCLKKNLKNIEMISASQISNRQVLKSHVILSTAECILCSGWNTLLLASGHQNTRKTKVIGGLVNTFRTQTEQTVCVLRLCQSQRALMDCPFFANAFIFLKDLPLMVYSLSPYEFGEYCWKNTSSYFLFYNSVRIIHTFFCIFHFNVILILNFTPIVVSKLLIFIDCPLPLVIFKKLKYS